MQVAAGTRVKLLQMQDAYLVPPGTCGTVTLIDDSGTIHVLWDSGSTLGLIPGEDSFKIIKNQG